MKAGHLGEGKKHLICDSKKVSRAKERAIKYWRAEENSSIAKGNISGIFVDSRKDNALSLIHDETTGKFRKYTIKESHITVTEEPKGRYLAHYTPDPKTTTAKPGKQCAIGLFEWLNDISVSN